MKRLRIPYLKNSGSFSLHDVARALDALERHHLAFQPWTQLPYEPQTHFSIAHAGDRIFLKYYVQETTIKASHFRSNEPVYKDSCVEFFIALEGENNYYNFEFNPIGTCKLNFGDRRSGRKLISDEAISTIRFTSTINNDNNKHRYWEITLAIPVTAFSEHNFKLFTGKHCKGNFYKCGDELPQPHYMSWNNVVAPGPDFHVPDSFGEIIFG